MRAISTPSCETTAVTIPVFCCANASGTRNMVKKISPASIRSPSLGLSRMLFPLVIEILVPLTRQHCRVLAVLEGVAALGFQHLRHSNYTIANNITGGLPLSVAMSLILMKFDLLFLND